jgi:hypothetical protein
MFDIPILDEPTELLLRPAEKKNHYANREQSRSKKVCEPEERLWKLSAQAASPICQNRVVRAHPVSGHRCRRSGQLLR